MPTATPVVVRAGHRHRARWAARPVAGILTIVAVGLILYVALGLFRGDFTGAVPVTVISDRAGLIMNPDAKVELHGVPVGRVASIDARPNSTAVIHLAMDPAQLHLIPANVRVDIASTTVFGAKYVHLIAPDRPSPETLQRGQVIQGEHVTVEINTVFERLSSVLSTIEPEKLNQTLTAIASGLAGRGQKLGEAISDLDASLATWDPSLGSLSHDIDVAPTVLNAYADAMPDLLTTVHNASSLSRTIVQQQRDLDGLLLSTIGFGDIGNDVLGANRRSLTDVLHLLNPVTGLTNEYNQALNCALAGAIPMAKLPPSRLPGAEVMASLEWGADRYRYPSDLPKVAAKGGPHCVGLPQVPFETRPPYVVADVGTNPWKYGNQGIRLNTSLLQELLLGHRPDGPPRNSAQIGMPG
ncbi:MCE family protein [Mycobacterium kyorinense]|uniref:MCE family protein n=1 Tax=Mycobacterium kyorinense TaxID=487514 RepID=UPI0009DEEC3C|nr:MCE family protein [Mycobacterium kyorinense]